MARRKFAKLKTAMFEAEITQADLARATGKGITYISRRMNGHEPFDLEDVRKIGMLLHIDRAQWLDYFMEGA